MNDTNYCESCGKSGKTVKCLGANVCAECKRILKEKGIAK